MLEGKQPWLGKTGKGKVWRAPCQKAGRQDEVGQQRPFAGGPGTSPWVTHLAVLGLANSRAVGRQCWLPGMLSARSWHAGPEPAATARATVSPLFLVPMHPEAVAAFPTPTGRMWDFPGCKMQQQEAFWLGQWLSCQRWAEDSSDGLSPLCACSSPSHGALANLNPFVWHPTPNSATQEKKLISPEGDTPTGLEKQTDDFYFQNISFLSS